MVKQIFTLIENKVPPSCVAAILFHCTIHYTILLARCAIIKQANPPYRPPPWQDEWGGGRVCVKNNSC